MRVVMVGMGTRGDAQPMAVLGAELAARGHHVTLGLCSDLVWIGRALGLHTVDLKANTREFMESSQGRQWLAAGDVQSYVRSLLDYKHRTADQLQADLIDLASNADLLVSGTATELEAVVIAEAAHLPYASVYHAPIRSNSAFPHLLVSTEIYSPEQNLATYAKVDSANWPVFEPFAQKIRARVGLPATAERTGARLARTNSLELQAYSRHVVPELADWDPRRPLTGFLTPSAEQRELLDGPIDPELEAWLDAGDPPVYFGFGSMPVLEPEAALTMIEKVADMLGVRALVNLSTGPGEGDAVRVVGNLDHEAVLPRCLAAVHHGGAGTSATSLRAGLPTVVCAVFADQPFWGAQLQRMGVGSSLRFTDLSEPTLFAALEPMLADGPRQRAAELAALLRDENAAAQGADALEQSLATRP
ncbi:glycosyltransferase [Kribbella sp. CA-293567]|uniref:glycosyltransferase n=1 Tax=Kribbella sp. CA-293567 TaxID=3002436 RepID=UPI0022DD2585|nr:glycosyltransferase [Kribbella sp. CA-293567]WBQ05143.1 glycosyltransferase [Kribbella sp. CA-293567]